MACLLAGCSSSDGEPEPDPQAPEVGWRPADLADVTFVTTPATPAVFEVEVPERTRNVTALLVLEQAVGQDVTLALSGCGGQTVTAAVVALPQAYELTFCALAEPGTQELRVAGEGGTYRGTLVLRAEVPPDAAT